MPAGHFVHDVAPMFTSTTCPPPQTTHAVCEFASWSYVPATQLLHAVAPAAAPVSVVEPASHGSHGSADPRVAPR